MVGSTDLSSMVLKDNSALGLQQPSKLVC
uniref:Uncharacterized protein n=1 Tax=Anguilla anguilla TaxID=7936 RepID=A0A0E9XZ70_ANGAN